jgi:hypothetical protein
MKWSIDTYNIIHQEMESYHHGLNVISGIYWIMIFLIINYLLWS